MLEKGNNRHFTRMRSDIRLQFKIHLYVEQSVGRTGMVKSRKISKKDKIKYFKHAKIFNKVIWIVLCHLKYRFVKLMTKLIIHYDNVTFRVRSIIKSGQKQA